MGTHEYAVRPAGLRRPGAVPRASWCLAIGESLAGGAELLSGSAVDPEPAPRPRDADGGRALDGCEHESDGSPQFDLRDSSGAPIAASDLPLTRALQGEACNSRELVAHRRDGTSLPVLASASPLQDGAGSIVGAVCILRDISALKEIERMREEWTAIVAHGGRIWVDSAEGTTTFRFTLPIEAEVAGR
jgi:hypothetical protein